MSCVANVAIHASQFPENVKRDLLESLRTRRVNHKFLYDSFKQTQKWLALHEAHSPARNNSDCTAIYDQSFQMAAARIESTQIHVIGLGCGGGQKDARLLKLLGGTGKEISYTPSDVSVAMTLVARQAALSVIPGEKCFPLVCDLATVDDLRAMLDSHGPADAARLVTFFGMIPNFEPELVMPKLSVLVRRNDWLLFSANLAPGLDYTAGVRKILPQYDNALTRDWLMTFLLDLGVERSDGELRFTIEDGGFDLKRVVTRFQFNHKHRIQIESEAFEYHPGEPIQLFFSYRYTPDRVRDLLGRHGIQVFDQWIARSEEEGVFLCRKQG